MPPPAAETAPLPPGSWTSRKTLAVVTGGVGLVGLGMGIAWSAYASSAQSKEQANCSASSCPNRPQAADDYNTAQKNATGATIGIAAGAALIAAGVVLWITAPPGASAVNATAWHIAPSVLPAGGGLTIGGRL